MTSVTAAPPPDDSGSDAFRRFSYQAHVVFPLCLRLYFLGDIVAIYCEHWEDVLVEFTDRLRFTQIKTRDAGRGPWKYRHLLDEGGALRSLLRTHRALAALGETRRVEYDICLEGAADSADEIMRLVIGGDDASDAMCQTCADRLEIPEVEARSLLERVTVTPNLPPRTMIAASNRDLLRLRAGHLPANELTGVRRQEPLRPAERCPVGGLSSSACRSLVPGGLRPASELGSARRRQPAVSQVARE